VEQTHWRFEIPNRDLGHSLCEAFAGSEVEGDAVPAPVVDVQTERGIGRGLRVRRDTRFVEVADHLFSLDRAGGVSSEHGVVRSDRSDGFEHFDLFGMDGGCVHSHRRLHCNQSQNLCQMILDHVSDRAALVEIRGTSVESVGFGDRDLDRLDVPSVPCLLEQAVREPEYEQVPNGLLAKEMVDPIHLRLRK